MSTPGRQVTLPLLLDLKGRRVLIVGAGPVSTRRATSLLRVGADIHVVAPAAGYPITAHAEAGHLTWHKREFRAEDVAGAWLVITATGIPEVDTEVAQLAESQQIWCVNAARATDGSASTPAVAVGPDGVTVAVSGGGDPQRAIAIRDAIKLGLADGSLPIHRVRAQEAPAEDGPEMSTPGRVTLVGGGPGDPGLITVRGLQAIALADVLVVDRLAPHSLWAEPGAGVEVIDVGKAPGRHAVSQEQINAVLIDRANKGRNVVRIKGGDPFVLGRGGEEAIACIGAGIEVDIIPGITSAISVPAAAGIPVTHRSITSSFVVASAHEGPAGVIAASAAAPTESTLVLLMGAGKLAEIASALVAAGRDASTPLAVIESGWTPAQQTTVSTLGSAAGGELEIQPPAVVVIGEVVAVRAAIGNLGIPSEGSGHV